MQTKNQDLYNDIVEVSIYKSIIYKLITLLKSRSDIRDEGLIMIEMNENIEKFQHYF